jgi:uncharacterized protein YbbK (DUF523 family)
MPQPILISACLLGINTRYNGIPRRDERAVEFLRRKGLTPVPVCPEQLGGLPTPRPACRFTDGDGAAVLDGSGCLRDESGTDVAAAFLRGAAEVLKIARDAGCQSALLKERSPSCGVHYVYRGGTLVPGQGVTCALLSRNRIQIFSEEEI